MTKLQDVAEIAGVSTATVSRTMNNPELVDPATRSKVEKVIHSVGYTRNETARSLALSSTRTIGILADTFSSPYFTTILDETIKFLQRHNYFAIVEITGNLPGQIDEHKQQLAWQSLISRRVDAIIILSVIAETALLDSLIKEFPASVVMSQAFDKNNLPCITFDDRASGRIAAQYLLEKGHTQIAMLTGPERKVDSSERTLGFIEELAKHGIELPTLNICSGNYTILGGQKAMQTLLDSSAKFTAVFAQNDHMALGAISTCHKAGVEIPNDLSFVGHDDSEFARVSLPNLTSIRQPLKNMSQAAATFAMNLSKKNLNEALLPEPQIHFQPELVERDSVKELC